jgi:hypothetical protein
MAPNASKQAGDDTAAEGPGYDGVLLVLPGGVERRLTRAEYERLPLQTRIKSLIEGGARFFLGDREVSSREALKGS